MQSRYDQNPSSFISNWHHTDQLPTFVWLTVQRIAWRVDVVTSSKRTEDVTEPVAIMELRTGAVRWLCLCSKKIGGIKKAFALIKVLPCACAFLSTQQQRSGASGNGASGAAGGDAVVFEMNRAELGGVLSEVADIEAAIRRIKGEQG